KFARLHVGQHFFWTSVGGHLVAKMIELFRSTGTLALMVGLASVSVVAEAQSNQAPGVTIEEIVVSAQKRDASLLDTPISISAISGEDIAERNLVSMEDYLSAMPSVTHNNAASVLNDITFRGLGGFWGGDATVGVYFGEVPMVSPQYSIFSADMKLVDMARVEVLRGPQGSLYGSSSLGGTLRSIPNAPDLKDRA